MRVRVCAARVFCVRACVVSGFWGAPRGGGGGQHPVYLRNKQSRARAHTHPLVGLLEGLDVLGDNGQARLELIVLGVFGGLRDVDAHARGRRHLPRDGGDVRAYCAFWSPSCHAGT